MEYHLLLIREDISSTLSVSEALKGRGYSVAAATHSRFQTDPGIAGSFDLIVIDHSEPRINAMDICIELRQRSIQVPIVVLAATHDHAQHRVAVFRAGADDCLVKPVDLDELQIRIESLLVRSDRNRIQEIAIYEFQGRLVDFNQSHLVRNGSRIELSEREVRLLRYFVQHRGKTLSRDALLRHVWGYPQAPLTRTVDVHILRLRQKIEDNPKDPQFILTVPGFGYRFVG
jgi:two-component system alkaline phosphatase synthesis response regulator PhoP